MKPITDAEAYSIMADIQLKSLTGKFIVKMVAATGLIVSHRAKANRAATGIKAFVGNIVLNLAGNLSRLHPSGNRRSHLSLLQNIV